MANRADVCLGRAWWRSVTPLNQEKNDYPHASWRRVSYAVRCGRECLTPTGLVAEEPPHNIKLLQSAPLPINDILPHPSL
ncbi:hypothetical protein [[Phormidium] sp. ETS-05]|uniref:hypothetical protein n=1 Tax=[Phormidium] sp. ETS-05 TaxID=222819 RepID=UPI0018EF3201|nr:hypothetical protein [[Phormidium] sp. ETS-05]